MTKRMLGRRGIYLLLSSLYPHPNPPPQGGRESDGAASAPAPSTGAGWGGGGRQDSALHPEPCVLRVVDRFLRHDSRTPLAQDLDLEARVGLGEVGSHICKRDAAADGMAVARRGDEADAGAVLPD